MIITMFATYQFRRAKAGAGKGTKSGADAGGEDQSFAGDAAYDASAVGHVSPGRPGSCLAV